MPKRCAIWLDHSKAWIVTFTPGGDPKVEMLESGITAIRKTTGGARSGTPYLHGCATRKGDDESGNTSSRSSTRPSSAGYGSMRGCW